MWPTHTRSVRAHAAGLHSSFAGALKQRKQLRFAPAGRRGWNRTAPRGAHGAPRAPRGRPGPASPALTCVCSAVGEVQRGGPGAPAAPLRQDRQQGPQRQRLHAGGARPEGAGRLHPEARPRLLGPGHWVSLLPAPPPPPPVSPAPRLPRWGVPGSLGAGPPSAPAEAGRQLCAFSSGSAGGGGGAGSHRGTGSEGRPRTAETGGLLRCGGRGLRCREGGGKVEGFREEGASSEPRAAGQQGAVRAGQRRRAER